MQKLTAATWFVLLLLTGSGPARGQAAVSEAIRAFVNDPELAGAAIGISVIDVGTGRTVGAYQPQLALIPASTQKLLTTAAALDLLGPDHVFTTRLLLTGELTDGTLHGDLYVVGGGDPALGSPYHEGVPGRRATLDRWTDAVRRAGVRRITGRVVGDGSYFGTAGSAGGWPWSDLGNYFGAGSYGLNFHENFYFLDLLQRSRVGAIPPVQRTRPGVPGLRLTNELRSGPRGSGDQAYIYGAPFGYDNYVRGTIPAGTGRFTIKGALPDPPLYVAQALTEQLRAAGVTVDQPATTARLVGSGAYADGRTLDVYRSPTLTGLVDRTNLRSNNLYAETLLRALNKSRGRENHELASTAELTAWLTARGLDVSAVRLEDGSGLATRNYFPAAFMTAFLRDRAGDDRWRASIPLAGRTGSLRSALRGTAAEGRLWAKSGSLGGVRAYAGYARRPDGSELAFSIMVNNFTVESRALRQKMFRLMTALCRDPGR